MEKAAVDIVNALKKMRSKSSADIKAELLDVFDQLDQLSAKAQRDVADAMEEVLIRDVAFIREDFDCLKEEFQNMRPDTPEEQAFVELDNDIKFMMAMFDKVASIKGKAASACTKKVIAGQARLQEMHKDDLPAFIILLNKAGQPQSGCLGETKKLIKQSAKGFFAPLTAVYNCVTGRKMKKEEPKPPPSSKPKPPKS